MRWCLFLLAATLSAQLTTSQWGNARTNANLHEPLRPDSPAGQQFAKLYSLKVDGDVYAQPLFVPNVPIPGKGKRNVVFVATEHDSVYAFEAGTPGDPLWHVSFLKPGSVTTLDAADVQCPFIHPEIGITSTPVIDLQTGTLYVLARTSEGGGALGSQRFAHRLHALAITTGVEKFSGPIEITAPGFDGRRENPRAGLLLVNDQVILTWGSSCDVKPYNGWVMAYDKRTLKQTAAFNTSPSAGESGIWQSDTAPAADAQCNIYLATGNGKFNPGRDYGDTVLKLDSNLRVLDSYTPPDQEALNARDLDIGSGGPSLLSHLLLFGGKNGVLYALDPDHMNHAPQTIRIPGRGIYSAPAYWNGHFYVVPSDGYLLDFQLDHGRFPDHPTKTGNHLFDNPGATPAISANGDKDGIVWVVQTKVWNDYEGRPARLFAYDANDITHELFRGTAGNALRFVIPTVINGYVYVGVKGGVDVFGPKVIE